MAVPGAGLAVRRRGRPFEAEEISGTADASASARPRLLAIGAAANTV
jgi:hypothetical protein